MFGIVLEFLDGFSREKKENSQARVGEIVKGKNQMEALVELYRMDLDKLLANYKAVGTLDADILRELGVSVDGLKKGLKEKIKGLKCLYWAELFSRLDSLTSRLTTETRRNMLERLNAHMHVDFTESNISAIVIWALKNINRYIDSQLLEVYLRMTNPKTAKGYKSNSHMTFDTWRYCRTEQAKAFHHYKLEYRLVLESCSAIGHGESSYSYDYINNLSKSAHEYIGDIFTIANNLGFRVTGETTTRHWESNQSQAFHYSNSDGVSDLFCEIRAFKNGNIHIKANQDFIKALNVEAGRLNGWIKSPKQASDELNMPVIDVERFFMTNLKITSTPKMLLAG